MARLFPSKLIGAVSPEVAKVLQALKRVPGDEFLVWVRLPLSETWGPSLMVIDRQRSCHVFGVSALTDAQAELILQYDLFTTSDQILEPADFEANERQRLSDFVNRVFAQAGTEPLRGEFLVRPVIACPNVSQASLDEIATRGRITNCELWGRETLRSESLSTRIVLSAEDGTVLPPQTLDLLREKFSPEIGIPDHLLARLEKASSRSTGARLTPFLLDLNQEFLAKDDLLSSDEADGTAKDLRLRLVTGVAGSGKSLILLYRAMLQANLQPGARILVLTHNRPLSGELRDRFRRLCPGAAVEWTTFYQWCRAFSGARWDMIKPWERETLIRELISRDAALARLPEDFVAEEIDWIRDQAIVTRQEYLDVPRLGRKRPLNDDQRNAVFSLLVAYCRELKRRGLDDWTGAASSVWRQVDRGLLSPPVYDSVLVDEAQFFAPTWLRLIRKAVRPSTGQLFLAADPTQGFLRRRQSWLSSGLNVRGNSARLLRCYRNTSAILEFACTFYRSRVPAEEEEVNLPTAEEFKTLEPGEAPQLIRVDCAQGECARVANEILAAIRSGANPEHFLVLQSDAGMVDSFIQLMKRIFGRPVARDLKDYTTPACGMVKVSSLNAATGLECPVVFLCGLDSLLEREHAIGLDGDQKHELIRDNTRRIYMGITRASQKVVITYQREATNAAFGHASSQQPSSHVNL